MSLWYSGRAGGNPDDLFSNTKAQTYEISFQNGVRRTSFSVLTACVSPNPGDVMEHLNVRTRLTNLTVIQVIKPRYMIKTCF